MNLAPSTEANPHHNLLASFEDLRKDRRMDPILNQIKEKVIISVIINSHSLLKKNESIIINTALHLTSDLIGLKL